jgi:hypothetical protein
MAAPNVKRLREFLTPNQAFTRELIRQFYENDGEQLTEENLKVRVNRLKAKGIIVNVGRGLYQLNTKKVFEPEINLPIKKLSDKIRSQFPFLNYLLWSTTWLNQFLRLQMMKNITVVEVESGSEDSVFRYVKDSQPGKTFLNPSETEWMNYIAEAEDPILIRSMISESPKETEKGLKIPKLEKILVDLYCDRLWQLLFSFEIETIFREACLRYVINFSTMLSYASRRGKRVEIWNYIKGLQVLDNATINMIEK